MANYSFQVFYDSGIDSILISADSNVTELNPNDSVTFQIGSGIIASEFDSGMWTNASSINSATVTKYVKSNATAGFTDTVRFTHSSGATATRVLGVYEPPDYTPDSFTIPNVTNANPKDDFSIDVYVGGYNRRLYVYVNSGNGYEPRGSLEPYGETYSFIGRAPQDYGLTQTIYVRIYRGPSTSSNLEYSTSFTVTTKTYPDVDELLEFPLKSAADGDIGLKAIGDFFGTGGNGARLTDYCRGNYYVPTIAGNEHVPTSPPIRVTDLYGTYTGFYFIYPPTDRKAFIYSTASTNTLQVEWDMAGGDIEMGYGPLATDIEYKYEWTIFYFNASDGDDMGDYTITGRVANLGQWAQGNTLFRIVGNAPQGAYAAYSGWVDIHVRNAVDPSLEFTRRVNFGMQYYS